MPQVLRTLLDNPVFLAIALALLLALAASLVLRLMKLATLAAIVLIGYVAVLHFTGAEVPREIVRVEDAVKHEAVKAGRAVGQQLDHARRQAEEMLR